MYKSLNHRKADKDKSTKMKKKESVLKSEKREKDFFSAKSFWSVPAAADMFHAKQQKVESLESKSN